MILSVIRLSFCFANDNRIAPHPVHILKKKYKPDGVSSDCHFVLQMTTEWHPHPVYKFFQNDNRMTSHLVVKLSNRKSRRSLSTVSQSPN